MANYFLSFKKNPRNTKKYQDYEYLYKNIPMIMINNQLVEIKSLEKLDEFTANFNNELELKEYLCKSINSMGNEIVINKNKKINYNLDDYNNPLVIHYKANKQDKFLAKPYGIIYKEDKKYLHGIKLQSSLLNLATDLTFINKLTTSFRNYHPVANILPQIRYKVSEYNKGNLNIFGDNEPIQSIHDDIYIFFEDLLFRTVRDKYGNVVFENGEVKKKLDYLNLHRLAKFVSNYLKEKDKNLNNQEDVIDEIDFQEEIDDFEEIDEYIQDSFARDCDFSLYPELQEIWDEECDLKYKPDRKRK